MRACLTKRKRLILNYKLELIYIAIKISISEDIVRDQRIQLGMVALPLMPARRGHRQADLSLRPDWFIQ